MKKTLFLVILGSLLSGCSVPGSLIGMSKDQLEALVKMKDAGAVCIQGQGPPLSGSGNFVSASIDKGIKGTVKVTPDCGVAIETK